MNKIGNLSPYFKRPYNGLYGGGGGLVPLAGIIDLSATESGGNVSLTWTDPDDIVKGGKTITAWTSTKIVRKEGSAPTDSTDGDLILTETTKNQYSSSGYTDSTISVSGTYYYTAFAIADNGLETISNIENVSVVIQSYKTFTITREEKSDMSSGRVYSDDATGMTTGSTDFDEFFGYSAVLLDANGNEIEEVKQSTPGTLNMSLFQGALTGTANNVMIKFPKRGIKMSKTGNFVSLSITNEPDKTGFQYYAFTKGTTVKDYLYLGAYKGTLSDDNSTVASAFTSGTTYLKSRAVGTLTQNFCPAASLTIGSFRDSVSKYGNGYSLICVYPRRYINCLYMMKYGNPDGQATLGPGYTNAGGPGAPGISNSMTNASGATDNTQTGRIRLFGLEDWWGNITEILDCCYLDGNRSLTVDKTNSIFQSSAQATVLSNMQRGYCTGIAGTNDGMFECIRVGTEGTYYRDYVNSYINQNVTTGGDRNDKYSSGLFSMTPWQNSFSGMYGGARMMYL